MSSPLPPITPRPPRRRATKRVALSLDASKGASQDDAAAADINSIAAQYFRHGTLPNVRLGNPLYGDFQPPDDLQSVIERSYKAEDRFKELPAQVRSAADNDWLKFLDMFKDDSQRELLVDAGLIIETAPEPTPEPTPAPTPTPSADPAE